MNTYGLTEEEYKNLLKECGMYTKKWTYSKWKRFNRRRLEIIHNRQSKKSKPMNKTLITTLYVICMILLFLLVIIALFTNQLEIALLSLILIKLLINEIKGGKYGENSLYKH